MNTLIPGAPLRSLSPTTNEYQRAAGGVQGRRSRRRAARFTLDAPEHSGTIPGARGDILTPGVALTSNLAVIFTLNQHTSVETKDSFQERNDAFDSAAKSPQALIDPGTLDHIGHREMSLGKGNIFNFVPSVYSSARPELD